AWDRHARRISRPNKGSVVSVAAAEHGFLSHTISRASLLPLSLVSGRRCNTGHRPPRYQTGKHSARPQRPREGGRLWTGPTYGTRSGSVRVGRRPGHFGISGVDRSWKGHRHAPIHGARANGETDGSGPPRGHLFAGRGPLPNANRRTARQTDWSAAQEGSA